MLNIFVEQQRDEKKCPTITYHDRNEIFQMVDWNKKITQLTENPETIVVIGYWHVFKEGIKPHYERYYIINLKDDTGSIFLQEQPENNCDILLAIRPTADKPQNTYPVENVLGGIKVVGHLKEECLENTSTSNSIRYRIARQLAIVPVPGKMWTARSSLQLYSVIDTTKEIKK